MTPEQEELIEAMVAEAAPAKYTLMKKENILAAIRAAEARGWVLEKRPGRIRALKDVPPHVQEETMGSCRGAYRHGWSQCLDAIETLKLDEGERNG